MVGVQKAPRYAPLGYQIALSWRDGGSRWTPTAPHLACLQRKILPLARLTTAPSQVAGMLKTPEVSGTEGLFLFDQVSSASLLLSSLELNYTHVYEP